MDREGIDQICSALPGVVLDYPFGPGTAVYKVGGKMFCMWSAEGGLSFKVTDMAYEILTENGMARPAPYLARAKWVNLPDPAAWDAAMVSEHLTHAHEIIVSRLTRKVRAELGLQGWASGL